AVRWRTPPRRNHAGARARSGVLVPRRAVRRNRSYHRRRDSARRILSEGSRHRGAHVGSQCARDAVDHRSRLYHSLRQDFVRRQTARHRRQRRGPPGVFGRAVQAGEIAGPIDRERAAESERVSRRAITGTWHRRGISWIAAVTAVTRREAGTESTHTSAEAAAAHRHSSAEQPRENRRQHVRRGAVVLLILLILALGLVGLRTGRFVVLIILDRAGRSVRIRAIGRNSVDRRFGAVPA